jgi:hypothetical protein
LIASLKGQTRREHLSSLAKEKGLIE